MRDKMLFFTKTGVNWVIELKYSDIRLSQDLEFSSNMNLVVNALLRQMYGIQSRFIITERGLFSIYSVSTSFLKPVNKILRLQVEKSIYEAF